MGKEKKDKNILTTKKLIAAQGRYEEKALKATINGNTKLAKRNSDRARAINLVLELHRTEQL